MPNTRSQTGNRALYTGLADTEHRQTSAQVKAKATEKEWRDAELRVF